jgi:hypothetical protein
MERKDEWILVTEKTPGPYDTVLLTIENEGGYRFTYEGWYNHTRERYELCDVHKSRIIKNQDKVIAWMPLPEPYKEVNNES